MAVVFLVVGIISAVALPRWSDYLASYRATAAAQQIAADLARTQSLAYSSSSKRAIAFDISLNRYQIIGLIDPDKPSTTYTIDLNAAPFCAVLVSANFAGQSQLSFNGFGQPIEGGGTIIVRSGNVQKSVVIDADSGKVTVL